MGRKDQVLRQSLAGNRTPIRAVDILARHDLSVPKQDFVRAPPKMARLMTTFAGSKIRLSKVTWARRIDFLASAAAVLSNQPLG